MRSLYKSRADREVVARWCRERVTGHETRTAELGDVRVHLTVIGEGPVETVLVPGTNFNAATSLRFAAALAECRTVAVVDLPGQPGLSSGRRPRAPHRGWYAAALSGALDALDARGVTAVGHSLGAAVVAACESDRIAARALISPAGFTTLRLDARMMARSTAWLLAPSPERTRAMLADFTAPGNTAPDEIADWLTLTAVHCRSTLAPPPLPDAVFRRLRGTPLAVAVGEHDRFLPPARLAPAVRAALGVELRVLPGVGHLAVDEEPETIAALVGSLREG
ncbi:alpha/beta fold hydrolase [Glycomyces paridis]|uniref:alpha/beta fold hydrolase n=1 Tax=Glycomyces paridis TaxID=2126555 RepID=UPI0013051F40|nr:alpha/beta hydrolase [Glycomyces paridis]